MTTNQHRTGGKRQHAFMPFLVDVAVPLGSYYLFKGAFGMSTFAALAWSSVVPAVRTGWSLVRERWARTRCRWRRWCGWGPW